MCTVDDNASRDAPRYCQRRFPTPRDGRALAVMPDRAGAFRPPSPRASRCRSRSTPRGRRTDHAQRTLADRQTRRPDRLRPYPHAARAPRGRRASRPEERGGATRRQWRRSAGSASSADRRARQRGTNRPGAAGRRQAPRPRRDRRRTGERRPCHGRLRTRAAADARPARRQGRHDIERSRWIRCDSHRRTPRRALSARRTRVPCKSRATDQPCRPRPALVPPDAACCRDRRTGGSPPRGTARCPGCAIRCASAAPD